MNITFTLELSSHAAEKKEVSILIRMTQNRKLKRMSTGIKVLQETWDHVKKKIRKKHQLADQYNKLLDLKLAEAIKTYTKLLEVNGAVSPDDILREMLRDTTTNFFDFAHNTKMAEIKSRNKMANYRRYEAVLSKLEVYAGRGLSLKRLNYKFLKEYSLYLKTKPKNTDDTVSANLSVIRTIFNEAILHGIYTDGNPFDQVKLRYTDNTKEKLTAEELKRIFITPLPQIPSLLLARDFFLACFLAEGTYAFKALLGSPSQYWRLGAFYQHNQDLPSLSFTTTVPASGDIIAVVLVDKTAGNIGYVPVPSASTLTITTSTDKQISGSFNLQVKNGIVTENVTGTFSVIK